MSDACTVDIVLLDTKTGDPTTYTLVPTLDAMKAVNRYNGGIVGMVTAIRNFDLDAMATCIVAATGAKGNPEKVIRDRVYVTGALAVQKGCVRFMDIVIAGGRDPDEITASGAGEAPAGNG